MAAVLRPGPHGGSPASPGSPVAHQQSIRRLQSVAARARVSTAATEVVGRPSDLRRADRLLAGGGKIFEDVPLDGDDDDEEPPRVTELGGSWVFGRRVSDEAATPAEKRLLTLIATLIVAASLCAVNTPAPAPTRARTRAGSRPHRHTPAAASQR